MKNGDIQSNEPQDESQINEMRLLAESDYLTGLANRRGLYEYYNQLPKHLNIHAMFIDVDNFKRVNDIYGHSMGDEFLIQIAKLIQQHTQGFASRIGGDEYVVLFPRKYTQHQLERIAANLLDGMNCVNFRKDILSFVSLSIGIVLNQSTDSSLDDILAKCDAAMYQAKYNGKNRFFVYKAHDKKLEISRSIELEMEKALENGEFQVFLQPKVNMVSFELYGAEALSRWIHPIDGERSPILYIPVFEKNGFIAKLDMYNFEMVCRMKASWKGQIYEHIPISVNMSRLHLYDRNFPETLSKIANRYEIPTNELEIEITESLFIKDNHELICTVDLLQSHGFLVSIDDFGAGFSALNLLKDIPANTIKIDREFLQESATNARGRKIIRNVIAMCKDLKLDVVTEGIETKEQVDFITSCGCQIAQGFYYAKPLPIDDFIRFAEEYSSRTISSFTFRLNGDLLSEDKSMKASYSGEGFYFDDGIFSNSYSLFFPGGEPEQNTVHIPTRAIVNDSFTISLWIKPKENHFWTSAIYIKFETGFCSILPEAWEGHSDFRIRDSKEINGWYDISSCQLRENAWAHYVVTYNAKTEKVITFINGEVAGMMEHVPTNRYVKWIILGGDVFQPSFIGNLCELVIYNEAKDYDFVHNLHQSYVQDEHFTAFDINH